MGHGEAGIVVFPFPQKDPKIDVCGGSRCAVCWDGRVLCGSTCGHNPVCIETLAEQGHVQANAHVRSIAQWREVVSIAQLHHSVGLLPNFVLVNLDTKRTGDEIYVGVNVQHGRYGSSVDTHPLVSVPSIDVSQVRFSSRTDVEGGRVIEPLGELGILLGRKLAQTKGYQTQSKYDVANHLISLIFSRLRPCATAQRLAKIGNFAMHPSCGAALWVAGGDGTVHPVMRVFGTSATNGRAETLPRLRCILHKNRVRANSAKGCSFLS